MIDTKIPTDRQTASDRIIGSVKWGIIGSILGAPAGVLAGKYARKGRFGKEAAKYASKKLPLLNRTGIGVTHGIAGASIGSKAGSVAGLAIGRKKDKKELSATLDRIIQFGLEHVKKGGSAIEEALAAAAKKYRPANPVTRKYIRAKSYDEAEETLRKKMHPARLYPLQMSAIEFEDKPQIIDIWSKDKKFGMRFTKGKDGTLVHHSTTHEIEPGKWSSRRAGQDFSTNEMSARLDEIIFARGDVLKKFLPTFPPAIKGGFPRKGFVQKEASDALKKLRRGASGGMMLSLSSRLDGIIKFSSDIGPLGDIALAFRTMQLYAHNSHHLMAGPTFMQDHEFFGSLYDKYSSVYDSLAERIVGLNEKINLVDLQEKAANNIPEYGGNCYQHILEMERQACGLIESAIKANNSQGTINLLAGIADESEVRQYKIGQRLKKSTIKLSEKIDSVIQFGDPRPRNPLGEFSGSDDGVPDPNTMVKTYGQAMRTKALNLVGGGAIGIGAGLAGRALYDKIKKARK